MYEAKSTRNVLSDYWKLLRLELRGIQRKLPLEPLSAVGEYSLFILELSSSRGTRLSGYYHPHVEKHV